MFGDFDRAMDMRGWQAAGLSLAAGGIAATRGPESLWTAALAVTIGAVAALIAFRLPVDRSQIQPAP